MEIPDKGVNVMNGHDDACQELKDELDQINRDLRLARQQLLRANPSEKPAILAKIRSLMLDEHLTGLALAECRQRNPILFSIFCDPFNATISIGAVQQFTAVGIFLGGSPQNLTTVVTWASFDPSVATISNAVGSQGQATGVRQGTTTITAADSSGSIIGTATLSVGLVSIAVSPSNIEIKFPGSASGGPDQEQFTASGTFADGSARDVTASVLWGANPAVATISNSVGSQGRAIGVSPGGQTTITAATRNAGSVVIGEAKLTVI